MAKTILITGATRGIGQAIAYKFGAMGYNLALNYASNESDAAETQQTLEKNGIKSLIIKADISNSKDVDYMFEQIIKTYGKIDVLINNAGLNIDRAFIEMTEDEWERVINVNMKGTFLVSQKAAKQMLMQDTEGIIINIGSSTGIGGRTNGINYCSSKAGILMMTRCMAKELGPKIRVNSVIPGFTRTKETEERFNLKTNEPFELEKRKIPLNRLAEPVEIANLIEFLVSEKAAYINGQKFIIDGGEYMC